MASADASIVGVATVILIFLPGLILNGMFLFMYGRRYRLRIPAVYFLVSLCVLNGICLSFWITTTMIAQFGFASPLNQASPNNGYCLFQALLYTYYQTIHMHTFCLLGLERVLKFYKPTLHTEVFYNDIVIMAALVVMWIIELIPALFHVMTWGVVQYFEDQYQCAYNEPAATSRLNAMFMYTYIIPFLFTLICFICVFIKYFQLKSKVGVSPGYDDSVIEEDLTSAAGTKKIRPGNNNNTGKTPYGEDDDSDEEIGYNSLFAVYGEDTTKKDDVRIRQRVYKYRNRELEFAILIFLIFLVFVALWMLYIVVIYMRGYDPTTLTSTSALTPAMETAATFLSHFTMSLCPCLYWIVNRRYRRHLRLACNCHDRAPKEPKPQKVYPQPTYNEPIYGRQYGGPQVKNLHRGSLGAFT